MDNHLTIRLPKRLVKATLVFALVAAVISPIAVSASHVFDDVPDSNVFHEDIAWLANAGITFGCNPPTNTNYCPNDNVTRAQMAAFMRRLAEGQVVDAATAGDADTVGGYAPDSLIRAAGRSVAPTGGGPIFFLATEVAQDTTVSFAEVTINAPVAGALVINGSLNLYCQGLLAACNPSRGNVYINVDGTQRVRQYYALNGGNSTANEAAWNASNSGYVTVAAGDHTVKLDVNNIAGSGGSTWVWSGGLNVMFVPFGGDGSTPTAVTQIAPTGDQASAQE